jgi:hypothetical protein
MQILWLFRLFVHQSLFMRLKLFLGHVLQELLERVKERFHPGLQIRRGFLTLQEDSESHGSCSSSCAGKDEVTKLFFGSQHVEYWFVGDLREQG